MKEVVLSYTLEKVYTLLVSMIPVGFLIGCIAFIFGLAVFAILKILKMI